MFLFLPLLFLFFCSVGMRRYFDTWRASILFAAITTATALTAITESLSLTRALSFYPLMISWALLIVIGLKTFDGGKDFLSYPQVNFKNWFLSEKLLLGTIVSICAVTAVTAAVSSPNTWDSMTYHLPRVAHWIQNRTVSFYPTNIIRQLYITPWAEFAIAHLRILGGGETSANFVQWAAMAGSLIGVSLIARQLGASRTGQLLASTIAACLPIGILESVSTQTDYVCAFWLIVFVFFLIETQRTLTLSNTIAAGLSLGLAFLTKGSSYIFALPFLAWFLASLFKRQLRQSMLAMLLMIICVGSLNMGQYWRNARSFGSPMWTSVSLTNQSFDLKVLWVNLLRNMSIHGATPLLDVNEGMTQAMTRAAQFAGADINDPRASFSDNFSVSTLILDEDYAGNFLHAILFGIIFIVAWFYRGPRGKINFYVLSILSSFLLFCLLVRYQPFNSRFHLPLFILFCPVAGLVLEYFLKQKSIVVGIFLFLGSLPWLFLNHQHPWTGGYSIWKQQKVVQYFYKQPQLVLPYAEITDHLKTLGCKQIGLSIGENSWEYPWWALLAGKGVRIEHVEVKNASASLKYPLGDFQPCAIIVSGVQFPPDIMIGSAGYGPVGSVPAGNDHITVFLRKF
jgi:hypothetical protein